MKKLIALALVLMMVVACMSACNASNKATLDSVKKAGKLVVATSPDFPPFEYLDNGEVKGIEIEILELVCAEMGVSLEIKQVDFESVLPGVQAGKFDCGASGISVTADREKNTLFTKPYCLAAQAIVVTSGSSITCKADLAGKTVSVQTATTAEEFCMSNGYTVKAFAANADAEAALTTGKVDAWVIDDLTAAEMVAVYNAENPDAPLVILDEAMTTEPYAFAFAFGSESLVEFFNTALQKLLDEGKIEEIFAKYDAPYTAP